MSTVPSDESYENDFPLSDRWTPPRFLLLEFMGTFFYTLVSAGIVISAGVFSYQFTTDEMNSARHITISLANSFAFAAMLFVAQSFQDNAALRTYERKGRQQAGFSNYPVGHFNPAITFAVALVGASQGTGRGSKHRRAAAQKQLSPAAAGFYMIAQLLGAICAGVVLFASYPFARHSTMGSSVPAFGMGATRWHALFMEIILTFFLVLTCLVLNIQGDSHLEEVDDQFTPIVKERGGAPYVRGTWGKYVAPLGALLCLLACTAVGAPVSGLSLNPARSFGPALVSNYWIDHWIYWVGPYAGAFGAALVFEFALR